MPLVADQIYVHAAHAYCSAGNDIQCFVIYMSLTIFLYNFHILLYDQRSVDSDTRIPDTPSQGEHCVESQCLFRFLSRILRDLSSLSYSPSPHSRAPCSQPGWLSFCGIAVDTVTQARPLLSPFTPSLFWTTPSFFAVTLLATVVRPSGSRRGSRVRKRPDETRKLRE